MRKIALAVALLALTPAIGAETIPAPREGALHAPPLHGAVVRPYDAPDDPYAPGHRGVDVAAPEGTPVRASAEGAVSFAGNVAGNNAVTIDHDGHLKTSYSFLGRIDVGEGEEVERGAVVGTVGAGHPESGLPPHVHLSARRDDVYFDPLELYVGTRFDDLIGLSG